MVAKRIWRLLLLTLLSTVLCLLAPRLTAQTVPATEQLQQGRLLYEAGQFRAALSTWEQAERAYVQEQNSTGVAGSRINQAKAWEAIGLYRQACKTLTQALSSDAAICDPNSEAKPITTPLQDAQLKRSGLRNLGDNLRLLGNLDAAQQVLLQAAQAFPDDRDLWLSLGNVARDLGNRDRDRKGELSFSTDTPTPCLDPAPRDAVGEYRRAIVCYQQAASLTAQLNHFSLLVEVEQWLHNNGDATEAWATRVQVQATELRDLLPAQLAALPPNYANLSAQINFARSLTQLAALHPPFPARIETQLQAAIQQAKRLENPQLEAYAIGSLGHLYEQAGFWPQALAQTEQALQRVSKTSDSDGLYEWAWQQGRILNRMGERDRAMAAYQVAVQALQTTRKELSAINSDAQLSLQDTVEPLYRELVSLLLQPETNPTPAQLEQARSLIDDLQQAELENFLGCNLLNTDRRKADTVPDPTAAVFYPIILPDRLEIILKLPGQKDLVHYSQRVPQRQLEESLRSLRLKLEDATSGTDYQTFSQSIYHWLLDGAQPYLTPEIKTLVFVMESRLRNVPISTLYDGQQFLIEKYAVAMTPGLDILGPKQSRFSQFRALVAGLSTGREIKIRDRTFRFMPLENVEAEIAQIRLRLPHSEELIDSAFTTPQFGDKVRSSTAAIVHLATHGQFSSDPRETFILTASSQPMDVNEMQSLLQERSQQKANQIELLVLSACETASGDRRATLGLAGVALKSGAFSTLASLWSVSDAFTAQLMQQFYQSLSNGQTSKAESLRQAQLALIRSNAHPFYWSAFVLVGNWL